MPLHNGGKEKIFITRPDFPKSALSLLRDYDVEMWTKESIIPRPDFLKRISGKHGIIIHSGDRIDAEVLEAAGEQLKVIATMSAGFDHIDLSDVRSRNVRLGYTPEILSDAVAELAVGLLITATRRVFESHEMIVRGLWTPFTRWDWMTGPGLKNSVVGIFGMGHIGLEIAKRVKGFKPSKILYATRSPKEAAKALGAEQVTLDELLSDCDAVVVSVALNNETRGILNEAKLKLMKESAVLVNVSRAGVLDQDALIELLKKKKIRAAALDVMTPEPLPKNHKLLSLGNCFLTPHIGSAEEVTRKEMAELTSRNIIAGLKGHELPKEV